MKEKILTLIVGILIGAILATGGFMIFNKTNTSKSTRPDFPKGQMQSTDGNAPSRERGNGERKNKNSSNTTTDSSSSDTESTSQT